MENYDVHSILLKYWQEEALSPEEEAELDQWVGHDEERQQLLVDLRKPGYVLSQVDKMQKMNGPSFDRITGLVQSDASFKESDKAIVLPMSRQISWTRYAVAAAILVVIAGGILWMGSQHPTAAPVAEAPVAAPAVAPIPPGGNKAILTLADGSTIDLDSSKKGVLTNQGNSKVSKLSDGQLAYNKASDEKPTALAYNTLSTPRAGQFSLILPDGSKVWLNNASSLRYPVAFVGADRTVELTGEGYFEIAKDAAHPFKVRVHRNADVSEITVLGTSFNIMAYSDESVEQATLVDGAIRFSSGTNTATLKPHQQSILEANGEVKTKPAVDIDEITAWKNGYFHFNHTPLEATMRQLARWYDVDVEYRGNIPHQEYGGKIDRNITLPDILRGLASDQVHFKLEGRKLIVTP